MKNSTPAGGRAHYLSIFTKQRDTNRELNAHISQLLQGMRQKKQMAMRYTPPQHQYFGRMFRQYFSYELSKTDSELSENGNNGWLLINAFDQCYCIG